MTKISLRLLLLIPFVMVAAGQAITTSSSTATPTPEVNVLGPEGTATALPRGCSPTGVLERVTDFLDAFNRGDLTALAAFFPDAVAYPDPTKDGFQWYSVSDEQGNFITYDPTSQLMDYFAERHAQNEQLQLLHLTIGMSWKLDVVGLTFTLVREADDLGRELAGGKAGIDCDDQTIYLWNILDVGSAVASPAA